jgi:predicted component of type VI protein secretion system
MYRLLFQNKAAPREPFQTRDPSVSIGRSGDCTLCLPENGVSARHAAIERHGDGYHIRDLDSANGVHVNGCRVKQQRLASGDELEIGVVRLRFEIVNEPPPGHRRTIDPMQVAAALFVAALIGGQLVLLERIFASPRPRQARTDTGQLPAASTPSQAPPAAPAPGDSMSMDDLLHPLNAPEAAPPPPAEVPAVLNHMIKIARIDRTDAPDQVTLRVLVKAQVGEREMDTAQVAISVDFASSPPSKQVWLNVPLKWENFSTKTLVARYFGSSSQLQGYIVRSYYRKQLQDVVAVPATLADSGGNSAGR